MSQSTLETARSLIQQKKYKDARKLLNTIPDDPTARKWLARLDEISPEPVNVGQNRPSRGFQKFNTFVIAVGAICLVVGLVTGFFLNTILSGGSAGSGGIQGAIRGEWYSAEFDGVMRFNDGGRLEMEIDGSTLTGTYEFSGDNTIRIRDDNGFINDTYQVAINGNTMELTDVASGAVTRSTRR